MGAVAAWVACGGSGTEGGVETTGGEVCLPDGRVCLTVPAGGLAESQVFRISSGAEAPGGALSPAYDISSTRTQTVTFLKPATVSFAIDLVDGSVPSDSLLRLYTRVDGGDWEPLDNPALDRVKGRILGEVSHLSPFVVLRADRLPDGGLPIDIDGGQRDSGEVIPPFDASSVFDAGKPDAGRPDGGRPDAGRPDAGFDAGFDAGVDAGRPDAGQPDAGPPDAGPPDAGPPDAGPPDAGQPDAGAPDAGQDAGDDAGLDAGADAGSPDAGDGG